MGTEETTKGFDRESYLILCLHEEVGEVAKEVSKCLRFTCEHAHRGLSNLQALCVEYSDMTAVLHRLREEGFGVRSLVLEAHLPVIRDNYAIIYALGFSMTLDKKQYLLLNLAANLSKMQSRVADCLLFTTEHRHKDLSNLEKLSEAYSEVIALVSLLQDEGVNIEFTEHAMTAKLSRLDQFMEISRSMGTLNDVCGEEC